MKTTLLLLSLLSLSAFADEHYKCYNVQKVKKSKDFNMTIKTSFLTNRVKAVDLVSEIKSGKFQNAENPFSYGNALFYEIDQDAVAGASKMKFKEISKVGESTYRITLSESILKFQETGYAYYYRKNCFWTLPCFTSSFWYKCDKI